MNSDGEGGGEGRHSGVCEATTYSKTKQKERKYNHTIQLQEISVSFYSLKTIESQTHCLLWR